MEKTKPTFTPTWKWLMENKIAFVGFGFGSGLPAKAPGTWGSLMGMLLAGLLLGIGVGKLWLFLLAVVAFVVGIGICHETELALGRVHDYSGIVWDEIVAMLFVFSLIPQGFFWWIIGFAAFRFFDIVKPQPISWADSKVNGGLGVMLDDVSAAVYAVLVVGILALIF